MSQNQPHFAVVEQAINTVKQIQQYINVGMETTIDVAMDVVENDKENQKQVDELKSVMLDYVCMERDLEQFLAAVDHTKNKALESGEVSSLERDLDLKLKELQVENRKSNLKQHEKYTDLEQKIQELQNPDVAGEPQLSMPSTSAEDDEICMTEETVNTMCPYTRQEMKFPMQNKLCKHNYEKEAILEYISRRGKKAKCPVSGCANNKPIEQSDLEDHKTLRRYIERANRQAGKRTKH
ncbi:E3 SUMO-protein ligase NSE2-like [Haliotis cracherodii]|uniref:E3 SUMO-protein ligase NSE2-like n=1 Tax=Haliotis cracherodii TaxID=6455 RepID=UPI0039ED1715